MSCKGSATEMFHDDVDGIWSFVEVKYSDDAGMLNALHYFDLTHHAFALLFSRKFELYKGLDYHLL
jgi:hypothetical protein